MWAFILFSLALQALTFAQTPDMVVPTDPRCSSPQTRIRDGFGYLPDNSRCDAFIRCSYDVKDEIKSERQVCGCGRFWNDDLMTCVPALDQVCTQDPCAANPPGQAYPYVGNCRSYWTCDGTRTARGMCCDQGFRFQSGQGCVRDNTCTDFCNCFETTTENPIPCPFTPNAADPSTYIVRIDGRRYVMNCAPGTHYNASACKCSDFVDVPRPVCPIDFNLQCTALPVRDVTNRAYIENQNVNVDQGQCLFNGANSQLLVPRYANMDWRYEWAVRIAFDDQGNQNTNGPLYSNSACANAAPSVVIRVTRPAGVPTVEATISANTQVTISAGYTPSQRNDVYVWYDGSSFNICVKNAGGQTTSDSDDTVKGLTKRVHCTVRYGQNEDGDRFTGAIIESRVHIFCVPSDFCGS